MYCKGGVEEGRDREMFQLLAHFPHAGPLPGPSRELGAGSLFLVPRAAAGNRDSGRLLLLS